MTVCCAAMPSHAPRYLQDRQAFATVLIVCGYKRRNSEDHVWSIVGESASCLTEGPPAVCRSRLLAPRSFSLLSLPQPDTRPAAVLVNELHAGGL